MDVDVPMDTTSAASEGAGDDGGHYGGAVAAQYEQAFFYSSVEYRDWVMAHLLRHFGLPNEVRWLLPRINCCWDGCMPPMTLHTARSPPPPTHIPWAPLPPQACLRIVDIGGGTGNFTQALALASGAQHRVLCVDPFPDMLQKVCGVAMAVGRWGCTRHALAGVATASLPSGQPSPTHLLCAGSGARPRGAAAAGCVGLCRAATGGHAVQPRAAEGGGASHPGGRGGADVRGAVPPAGARWRGGHDHAASGGRLPALPARQGGEREAGGREGDWVALNWLGLAVVWYHGGMLSTTHATAAATAAAPCLRCMQIWREQQPHHSAFTAAMQSAGFAVEVRRGR